MKKICFSLVFSIFFFLFFVDFVLADTPTISFSSREKPYDTVSISYTDSQNVHHDYVIPRPVVPQYEFTPASGSRYWWVATNGNDSSSGTETAPLRTMNQAIKNSSAGDVIYVEAGVYDEAVEVGIPGVGAGAKSGEPAIPGIQPQKPIVLSAAPGAIGNVILKPSANIGFNYVNDGQSVLGFFNSTHDWTINGFVIEGMMGKPGATPSDPANGIYADWSNGIMTFNEGAGIVITNNVVYNNIHVGIKPASGTNYVTIAGNIVFANGLNSRDHGIYALTAYVDGNIVFDNYCYGLHMNGASYSTVTRNVSFANGCGGIQMEGHNNVIHHNTSVYNTQTIGVGLFYFRGVTVNNDVKNNIFAFNTINGGIDCGYGSCATINLGEDDYNDYYPHTVSDPDPHITLGVHEFFVDPKFTNASTRDFTLLSDSQAKGKGSDGKDLGAYESGGSSSTPTPSPSNSPTPSPSPKPGDINHDGLVNILDFQYLITNFTNIFSLNLIIANYGH